MLALERGIFASGAPKGGDPQVGCLVASGRVSSALRGLRSSALLGLGACASVLSACSGDDGFSAGSPARGPSEMLEGMPLLNQERFTVALSELPPAGPSKLYCDAQCEQYCESLQLANPVDRGLCPHVWGVGLQMAPLVPEAACRRLYADTVGRLPSSEEIRSDCLAFGFGEVAQTLVGRAEFVRLNARRWADRLQYDTESVSVERVYDADRVVQLTYEGRVAFDHFAAVMSAHPVLTRRHATALERVDALFRAFLGRPAFANEVLDFAGLYAIWENGYYDHPRLGMRLPDAYLHFPCDGGQQRCEATRYGASEAEFRPDSRADATSGGYQMWSGYLSSAEWQTLQEPGRVLARSRVFWEHAVSEVAQQYLGYDLLALAPEVGQHLADHLVNYGGDIRATHHALLTSLVYRQGNRLAAHLSPEDSDLAGSSRLLSGPLQQADAETWVDSVRTLADLPGLSCDRRLNRPNDFLGSDSPYALNLVVQSDWQVDLDSGRVEPEYRDLVRALGGCPDHSQGGRFKIVSVLSTANQLNFARQICDPMLDDSSERVAAARLLPEGIEPEATLTQQLAEEITAHQTRQFLGRELETREREGAQGYALECEGCQAEEFARPVCFALLSGAEFLFY